MTDLKRKREWYLQSLPRVIAMCEHDRKPTIQITLNAAREIVALLKQEAIKPEIVEERGCPYTKWYVCGDCRKAIDPGDEFCKHCGQPIKWGVEG